VLALSRWYFVEPNDETGRSGADGSRSQFANVRASRSTVPTARTWGEAIARAADGHDAIVAAGSDRGNELLAHVAARFDQPFAANVTALDGDVVTRVRWGGSLLEKRDCTVHEDPHRRAHTRTRRRHRLTLSLERRHRRRGSSSRDGE